MPNLVIVSLAGARPRIGEIVTPGVDFFTFFYFLPRCMECRRGLAMRILSVCLSVCPSDTRVYCDKTVEGSVQIFIPYERTFSLVF